MPKGKPHKKPPRSQSKGKTKHEDKKPRDRDRDVESQLVNGEIAGKEVDEVDPEIKVVDDAESRKYARRKIESNWDRYEEPEVDEYSVVVEDYDETKDFDYIRQNSASAFSHFKFKEEKEWENDLHRGNTKENSVLGLNLMQLAEDLKHYGMEEKLGLNYLMPEECKYCVKEIFKYASSKSHQSSTCHGELPNISEKIQWSFDGIEKYKCLIGLNQENKDMQRHQKLKQNTKAEMQGSEKNMNINEINSKNSYASNDSQDSDILDELLMDNITLNDSNEKMNICKNNENKPTNIDGNVLSHSNKDTIVDKENNSVLKSRNEIDASKVNGITCKKTESEEFDLDMLLEADISSGSSSKNTNVGEDVDADLDQWLDDLLT